MTWTVYMVRCADNSLYTGIAKDIDKRLEEHNGIGGARYTRGRQPVKLVYQESAGSRSEASRQEYQLKQLSKKEKETLVLKARA